MVRAEAVQARIDTTTALADIAEEFIADEQAKGFDTTKLEAALAAVRTQIDQAQTLQSTAARILADKAGFDANGQVVDPQQARQTLQTAHRTLQNADQTLRRARQDFRQAVQDYRLVYSPKTLSQTVESGSFYGSMVTCK